MNCQHECPVCEAVVSCYPPCDKSGEPKACRFCEADEDCEICHGTGEIMLFGDRSREDTRGYSEVTCPCAGAA